MTSAAEILQDDTEGPGRQSAVALSYQEDDRAPRVIAKGYGTVADTIIRTARENGLYVHQSPELVGLLMQVDLDAHIPPKLYVAVAELLAWLYRLESAPPPGPMDQTPEHSWPAPPPTPTPS